MATPNCDKCKHHFTWKEVQRSFLKGYKPIVCKKCQTEHQIADISKLIMGMLIMFPIIFFVLILSSALGLTGGQTFITGVIFLAIILAIQPFIVKYEQKTE